MRTAKSKNSPVFDLGTEARHPESAELDQLMPEEILHLLNAEDQRGIELARQVIPKTTALVEAAVTVLGNGGNIHYFGAGTSGRIAAQDAAELFPTFSLDHSVVQAHIAGGPAALLTSVENAEDNIAQGAKDAAGARSGDLVIGLAASGRTPYVGGALQRARDVGAITALVACVGEPELAPLADYLVTAETGPEVLTGSTRLKAATFQKSVLSGFSTALMVRRGKTYSNLMVSLVATNQKLRSRSIGILVTATGVDEEAATELLAQAGGDLKLALTAAFTGLAPADAAPYLRGAHDVVRDAVSAVTRLKSP